MSPDRMLKLKLKTNPFATAFKFLKCSDVQGCCLVKLVRALQRRRRHGPVPLLPLLEGSSLSVRSHPKARLHQHFCAQRCRTQTFEL